MANEIRAMSPGAIDVVRRLEEAAMDLPQTPIETTHAFHAGLYARTVVIPAGHVITGVLIKIPTLLIISGHALMYGENGAVELDGYNVLSGQAGRKQVFVAETETHLTMLFATAAQTVAEAEEEFTPEAHLLQSRWLEG